ncbi:hypothetical protein SAMN02745857_02761 [Andreprevotia lacus DSM 23236]|jgi:hypothetical protein|uniref:Uncharacterized protein n=1 Tax=Andreprevotia lacus DSM 23236 TaxID=1121001 RepID=A0A1W1XUM0_9NEIS|nr:hypothetical protein [Andreprevotia lacus]SMC27231.1 hypothetical protein SAMN02745857_02761 [Andreprevotia lacus DSM 23236]
MKTPEWDDVSAYCAQQIERLRTRLEQSGLPELVSAELRGQIAILRRLLAELPAAAASPPPPPGGDGGMY